MMENLVIGEDSCLVVSGALDGEGTLYFEVNDHFQECAETITKTQAIALIAHLQAVFELNEPFWLTPEQAEDIIKPMPDKPELRADGKPKFLMSLLMRLNLIKKPVNTRNE